VIPYLLDVIALINNVHFRAKANIPRGGCAKLQNSCPGPCAKLLDPLWFGAVHPGEAVLKALQSLRKRDLVISLGVAARTVRTVLIERCPDLLAENGGPVKVSHSYVGFVLAVRQLTMDLNE
jgi:hypothetical protein